MGVQAPTQVNPGFANPTQFAGGQLPVTSGAKWEQSNPGVVLFFQTTQMRAGVQSSPLVAMQTPQLQGALQMRA